MIRFKQLFSVKYFVPLGLVAVIGVILAQGLQRDPSELPSALINKPLPELTLPNAFTNESDNLSQEIQGQVTLLSVWATWCSVCLTELPMLKQLSKQPNIQLDSIVYKDTRSRTLQWLSKYGNPFNTVWLDESGAAGIELGVYGTPELYIIDKHGIVRYRHPGAVTEKLMNNEILPLVARLNKDD